MFYWYMLSSHILLLESQVQNSVAQNSGLHYIVKRYVIKHTSSLLTNCYYP